MCSQKVKRSQGKITRGPRCKRCCTETEENIPIAQRQVLSDSQQMGKNGHH